MVLALCTWAATCCQAGDSIRCRITSAGMEGFFVANATGMGEATLLKLAQGNHIDAPYKRELVKRLHVVNRVGQDADLSLRIDYTTPTGKIRYVTAGYSQHASARFGRSLAEMVLYGNGRFAGEKVELTPLNYLSMNWATMGWGMEKKIRHHHVQANLNLLTGMHYTQLTATRLSVYTQPGGEWIDADIRLNLLRNKPYDNTLLKIGGFGAGFDLKWMLSRGKRWQHMLWLQDVGLLWQVGQVQQLNLDTAITFQGVELPNLSAVANNNFVSTLRDSLKTEYTSRQSTKPFLSMLPALYQYRLTRVLVSGDLLSTTLSLRPGASFLPKLRLDYGRMLKAGRGVFFTRFSVGGYGDYDLDLGIVINKRRYQCSLFLLGVESLLVPAYNAGAGLYVGVNKKISRQP